MPEIAPSILSADFAHLGRDVQAMEEAGARMLHFDVMDGHFVPNLTVGIPVLASLRKMTRLDIDAHLMISNPDEMAEAFVEAGADMVSVHYETVRHLDRLLGRIREKGAKPGVVLNPHTPVSVLEDILPCCDFVLIMSVNPGFAAQEFISYSLEKVRKLRSMSNQRGLNLKIEIDGGMGPHNVAQAVEAGVDWIVSGSAIFGSEEPLRTLRMMQQAAAEAAVCS